MKLIVSLYVCILFVIFIIDTDGEIFNCRK